MYTMRKLLIFGWIVLATGFTACEEEVPIPRPKGYFRIDMPERVYERYEAPCPFTMEIPPYAIVVPGSNFSAENCMLNMHFPDFNATVHLTYRPLQGDLQQYASTARDMAMEHRVKANSIEEDRIRQKEHQVYGVTFDLDGNVASNYQFFVTDSTHHFVRGALYFNVRPNKDSLAPSIAHIKQDMEYIVNSVRWKAAPEN